MSKQLAAVLVMMGIAAIALYWMFAPPPPPGHKEDDRQTTNSQSQGTPEKDRAANAKPPGDSPVGDKESSTEEIGEKSSDHDSKTRTDAPQVVEEPAAPPAVKPLLAGWDNPAAVIVFSGEQHGYVEPCGCSLKQLGGVSRRADFFRQLEDREYPLAAFDLGGLVNRPTRRQGKLKLQMSLHALRDMRYGGVALGAEELRNGIELITYEDRPPFLACNIVIAGDPDLGLVIPKLILTVGGKKLGVTSVFGKSMAPEILSQTDAAEVEVLDPLESLKKTIAELEAEQPDLLILLSHARPEETKALAAEFPQLDIVAAIGGPEDPNPRPAFEGKTLWVWPGQKGKFLGVVGLFPEDAANRLKFEAVALDEDRFKEMPHMREHMRHYQEMLELQKLVSTEQTIDYPRNAAESDTNEFLGAETCGECHPKAYKHWKTTGHARGAVSLKQGRPGQEATYISRLHDPECVACHVTGWDPKEFVRYRSGWSDEVSGAHLAGQQCENCHGPGSRHVELERLLAQGADKADSTQVDHWRDFLHLEVDKAFDLCAKCHDGDNDPHFHTPTFSEYWDKVKHPWRD
ncbi:MAG: multiheme c-type cytochrome [Planctomycetota bacterium]|nr:multiheme c-type cytochrome [Planctomycetota bacterium]